MPLAPAAATPMPTFGPKEPAAIGWVDVPTGGVGLVSMRRRCDKDSSRFCLRIWTCCSSRRRRQESPSMAWGSEGEGCGVE